MMRMLFKFISLASIVVMLAGCVTDEDRFQGMSEQQIFQDAQTALNEGDYNKAVEYFEAQETRFPYGTYSKREQLNIIYAYYKNADYPSAQSAAERYMHMYPGDANLDYVLYLRALSVYAAGRSFIENYFPVDPSLRDQDPMKSAFSDFKMVVDQFPQSQYAADSRTHMIEIRNGIASNLVASAEYYYSRGAYVASLNNAQEVVQHYQGAPATADALVIMVRAYRQLHLDDEAKTTLSILQLNYPQRVKDINVRDE